MTAIHWQSLTWFDFAIVAILALSVLISFFRGFLREAVSLVTWIVAILVSLKFAVLVGDLFKSHIASELLRYVIGFVILFLLVFIVGTVINAILKLLVEKTGLSITDRIIGAIFGVLRGVLAVAVIIMLINASPMQKYDWYQNSQFAPQFSPVVTWLTQLLPEKIQQMSNWVKDKEPTKQSILHPIINNP